jgi:hypothetical protein
MDASPSHAGFTVRRADSRDAAAIGTMRAAQQREIDEDLPRARTIRIERGLDVFVSGASQPWDRARLVVAAIDDAHARSTNRSGSLRNPTR